MAKINLIGKIVGQVAEGVVGQNNTPLKKFIVAVTTGGGNNPRVANDNAKTSYFGVMAFGKLSEAAYAAGQTVEVDGTMEITDFQVNAQKPAQQAVVVTAKRLVILPGNVQNFAHAYNVLGNLVLEAPEIYQPQNGGKTVYKQKLAVFDKKVGEQEYTSFYRLVFFGDRGQKLADKSLLSKGKVKSVLVDGAIRAEYNPDKNDPNKKWLNVDILVDDFQVAEWKRDAPQASGGYNQNAGGQPEAYPQGDAYEPADLPPIDIDEDDIPF